MSRTLTMGELEEVRGMLRRGKRHVEISRELGLSLWTIARIASDPQMQRDDLTEEELPVDDAPVDFQAGELRRCRGCGAMVYRWPCLACVMVNSPRVAVAKEAEDCEKEEDEFWDLVEEVARS